MFFNDLDDDDDMDVVAGDRGLHEEFGDCTFVRWIDKEEETLLVEIDAGEHQGKLLEVYWEEVVFE